MSQPSSTQAKITVLLGVLGMSFSAILTRCSTAPSMVLVFYRIGLAALFMTVPGIRALKREWKAITRQDLLCCAVSGFFLALHFCTYFMAVKQTSIAAALVLVNTEVFFVSFVTIVFFREKLSGRCWFGIAVTFLGSVIIAAKDAFGAGGFLSGDLLALAGALFLSIYTVMGRMCRRHMSTGSYTMIVYWVTALTSLILLAVQRTPVFGYGLTNALCAFGMTVLCTLLGHSVISWGLKFLPPTYISTVKLLEPVFASVLGIFIFREIPGLATVLGGVIVIGGILITSRASDSHA